MNPAELSPFLQPHRVSITALLGDGSEMSPSPPPARFEKPKRGLNPESVGFGWAPCETVRYDRGFGVSTLRVSKKKALCGGTQRT